MKLFLTLITLIVFINSNCIAQYNATVAQDGSGTHTTVQAAINAAPTGLTAPYKIFIKNGKYREKINCNKVFIQLIGESVANTILYYDDPAIVLGTQNSYSFQVSAADFSAFNITFANTYGDGSQAVAVLLNADRAAFKNCRFLGNQDTLYTKGSGNPRHYFKDCYIDGNVDFIFGSSIALFENCYVYAKARASTSASYITAANTTTGQSYGYVFRNCILPANTGGTSYFLGRPWNNATSGVTAYNQTSFLNCKYGAGLIQPAGWSVWDAGTNTSQILYTEFENKNYNNTLVDVSSRVGWSSQLTTIQSANYYNNSNLFGTWDPCAVYITDGFCNSSVPDIAVANFRTAKSGNNSNFNWNISWPKTGIVYEVYRSINGSTYSVVNSQTAIDTVNIHFNYSESVPPPGLSYKYFVKASLAGFASHYTDTLTVSSIPTITTSGIIGSFLQSVGTPSNPQTYTVSGVNLTDNIIVTAPTNFEISNNNGLNWYNSSTSIVLTPTSGTVASTNISVRLNATTIGTYNGNITHTSTNASSSNMAIMGNTQAAALTPIVNLQYWPLTTSNNDDASTRNPGVIATTPSFNRLVVSDGSNVSYPPYSVAQGMCYAANGAGSWTTAVGGPGGSLSRTAYTQFIITASSSHTVHVDSIVMLHSIAQSTSNTRLAIAYSKNGFSAPADSVDVAGVSFATPVILTTNQNSTTTIGYRFALNGSTGIDLNAGQTLTIRIYNSCGSSSAGRYAKLKDVMVKGFSTLNPVDGEYQTKQSGNWDDVNTWERYNGTAWVYPAPSYPVYNNAVTTKILGGHTVTVATTLANGSGYVDRLTIKQGGQVIIAAGATLNLANDGAPSTTTTDLLIDGALSVNGGIATNGNVAIVVNGTFVNSASNSWNLSNGGDTVTINDNGIYQHNINSSTTPANLVCKPNSNFKVTGIVSNQTDIFKAAINYGNIEWDCAGQSGYYAFRANLHNNIQGKMTVKSTGSTYISFHNGSVKTTIPGGFYQTGGVVNFRENGTVVDSLIIGSDFSVSGTGVFNSNVSTGSTFAIILNGFNKSIKYGGNTLNNTNIIVNGIYNLDSSLIVPSSNFGTIVNGTLHLATKTITGSGNFTVNNTGTLTSAMANGLDDNIAVSGTETFNSANFVFNGNVAQFTGSSMPNNINSLVINNSAGVSLSSSTVLSGALTLTDGKLLIGNSNIATQSILGANASKYIVTNGTGMLTINNVGTGGTVFPIGSNASFYTPATLNNLGTIDNFSINVSNNNAPCISSINDAVPLTWNINEAVLGGSNLNLSLDYGTVSTGVNFNALNAKIVHCLGTTVDISGGTPSGSVVTINGISNFSPFSISSDVTLLPLQQLNFNAQLQNKNVYLQWETFNEININKYIIEHSVDGINFIQIAEQFAKNQATNIYSLIDYQSKIGVNFYRIKIIGFDQTISYSKIIKLNLSKPIQLSIIPNPFVDDLVIKVLNSKKYNVVIYNSIGQETININSNNNEIKISTLKLKTGIYYIKIKTEFGTITEKLIKN
jgi:pectin methylesterase-like acyl-CoA thioesterase